MQGLVVVGGGRMGEALARGLLAAGTLPPSGLTVVEKVEARRRQLGSALPPDTAVTASVPACRDAVIAVKPADVAAAAHALADAGAARVLSIAAGVTLSALEGWLGGGVAVLRAMPNTPALVGAGAAGLAAGAEAGADDLAWASEVLGAVGTVAVLPEALLDAVTGLSGSGPAYVYLLAEALVEAGVLVGLPRDTATALTVQTILGSARMLAETGDTPETLRAAVTSPGGTTAAGLLALERAGFRVAVLDAVAAATERARRLG